MRKKSTHSVLRKRHLEKQPNPKPPNKTKEVFVKSTTYNNSANDELDEYTQTSRMPSKASTALANPYQINDVLQALDEKVESMVEKSQTMIQNGKKPNGTPRWATAFICKVCGKEDTAAHIRDHIEANHLEGISIPCNHCEKTFGSRNALSTHNSRSHR